MTLPSSSPSSKSSTFHTSVMNIRKPTSLWASCGCLNNAYIPLPHNSHLREAAARPSTRPRPPRATHTYATAHDDSTRPSTSPVWPILPNPRIAPTPYQIFGQKRGEPYSKQRFYELVKLYHPDRHNRLAHSADANANAPCNVSHAVLLERYRLVVAANLILSDPAKRDAYDRYGFGWTDATGDGDPASSFSGGNGPLHRYTTRHRWRPNADGSHKAWWPTDSDPMYNATWEDWERWYERASPEATARRRGASPWSANFFSAAAGRRHSQSTVYANNYAFISVVFLLAALGGIGQATRATEFAKSRLERSAAVSEETSKVLMRVRDDTRGNSEEGETKDSRIRRFLRDKDMYEDGEFDGRALRKGDEGLCVSGQVVDTDKPRYWEKPPEQR